MAYDKVVDSSVLDAGLKAIADAIREKAGVEDTFAFPAGFLDAIAGIESGGFPVTAYGSFTPVEDTTDTYTIDIGTRMQNTCSLYLFCTSSTPTSINGSMIFASFKRPNYSFSSVGYRAGGTSVSSGMYAREGSSYYTWDDNGTFTFKNVGTTKNYTFGFKAGETYTWLFING